MSTLAGFQRKYLRGLIHGQRPIVQVGRGGLSDAVKAAVDAALLDHELVKVQLVRPDDKKQMAEALAVACQAELCGLIGHQVVLYRAHPESPTIRLPKRPSDAEQDPSDS